MIKVQGHLILPPRMDCVGAEIKLCLTMWHVVHGHYKLAMADGIGYQEIIVKKT